LIPLHFASHEGFGGPVYVISFACGSMLITIFLWIIRFLYELYRLDGAIVQAYHALPSLYIRQMWIPGSLSGLLWSAGNFMCIVAVTFLGQGVGYSFTQASVSVSALFSLDKCIMQKLIQYLAISLLAICISIHFNHKHHGVDAY